MARQITAEQSDQMSKGLGRLDKIAKHIQEHHEAWGLPFDQARAMVNDLDRTADEVEEFVFGPESLQRRQTEVVTQVTAKEASDKQAQVIQREPDEPYMDAFQSTQGVIQTDADEAYMSAYKDDQSSAVAHGADASGRKLAP